MPTGSEYSDVRLGSGDQSYKQTDREMAGGNFGQSNGQTLPDAPAGNYPNVYDRQAGQEPLGESSDENPFYYPEKVFEYIKCSGPGQSYVRTERESISGEFGQCESQPTGPYPGTTMVPSPTPSKQFSSKMSGDPKSLLASTRSCISDHASMNQAYGLNQPSATIGSHAWLRDSLATDGEDEPGNAIPNKGIKVPR